MHPFFFCDFCRVFDEGVFHRSIDWSIDWLSGRLIDSLIEWSIDWLIEWSIDWLIEWSIDWLIYSVEFFIVVFSFFQLAIHFILLLWLQASKEFVVMAQVEGKKWQKMLGHEHDQRVRLAEMVEQLAKQHSNLEEAAKAETAMVYSTLKSQQPGGSGKHVPTGEWRSEPWSYVSEITSPLIIIVPHCLSLSLLCLCPRL